MAKDSEILATAPRVSLQLGTPVSFLETGKRLYASFALNRRPRIALLLICRQLDSIQQAASGHEVAQLCQFIGGEGGTGKSRTIKAIIELSTRKGIPNRVIVTATSGTAAARINGVTIHSAYNFSIDQNSRVRSSRDVDGVRTSGSGERLSAALLG